MESKVTETHQLEVSRATMKNGRLSLRPCGKSFFPEDAFGGPNGNGNTGASVTIDVRGLSRRIRTDLPTYESGTPRWFFRDRTWVKPFVAHYGLGIGDPVNITRLSPRSYRIDAVPKQLSFIDLFAGIGGTRIAFEAAGAKCVFSSEWDRYAQKTYKANFDEIPHGDITKIDEADIPDHDILVAGFPCQPFSIAGVSKKNALGRAHGFADKAQGTLFFEIVRILRHKQPRAFMLENVRNLRSHDKGRTFKVIINCLRELGYDVSEKILDAAQVVPQHRERIFIVGTRPALKFEFPSLQEISKYHQASRVRDILLRNVPEKYTLTDHLWEYLQAYAEKHRRAGNGFGYGMADLDGITRTMSARYYKDGSEILIPQKDTNPRRLTPRECSRLMGFPKTFKIPVSDTQAYKQFGNSVVVPIVQVIAEKLVACICENRLGKATTEQLELACAKV